jgi:hypothetical protein
MHAARILGDIAADRARNLARRIGRVVKAVLRSRFADCEIANARLDSRGAELADRLRMIRLSFASDSSTPSAMRQCAARQASAGATRHDWHAARMTEPKHLDDLDLRLGEDDNHRQLTMEHEAIASYGLVSSVCHRMSAAGAARPRQKPVPAVSSCRRIPPILCNRRPSCNDLHTWRALLILQQLSSAARAEEPSWVGIYVNDEQSDAGVQKAIEAAIAT